MKPTPITLGDVYRVRAFAHVSDIRFEVIAVDSVVDSIRFRCVVSRRVFYVDGCVARAVIRAKELERIK